MSTVGMVHAALGMVVLVTGGLAMAARKKRGWHTWLGEIYHWSWLALAVTAMWVGAHHPGLTPFEIITPPAYAAALTGYVMGKRRARLRRDWLRWHIQGLSISYIAVIVALGFQILPKAFFANPLFFWGWMILPGVIMGRFVDRTIERWTAKGKVHRSTRPAPQAAPSGD